MSALAGALGRFVGADHVVTDPDVLAPYCRDWTGRFAGSSPALVRPGSTEEVAAVVAWCNANGMAVVAQGGNTGLVGGAVPYRGEVVLSLGRLSAIGAVDRPAAQVTAGAGATLADVQRAAEAGGYVFAVDLAARDSATIGGMVATNAGGLRVVRYGHMRAQVVGLEAVRADGTILSRLGGLVKDNTGYDWPGLLVGSEGTLAVITAARLRLVPPLANRVTALVAVGSMAEAVGLAATARRALADLDAMEFVDAGGVALVREAFGLRDLFAGRPASPLVLIECAANHDPTDALAELVGDHDAVVASDSPGRQRLWLYRDRMTEAIARVGVPHKLDVTLPASELAAFIEAVPDVVAALAADARVYQFGHVADGNVHVNVVGLDPDDETVDGEVLALAASMGGSISAEHGVGYAKRRWLSLCRSEAEIELFRSLKQAWDPRATLNPSVLL